VRLGFYFFIPDKNKEGPFGGMPQKNCQNLDYSGCLQYLSLYREWEKRECIEKRYENIGRNRGEEEHERIG